MMSHAWYAAYGSNLHRPRFAAYLQGGSLPHASRVYPGCRDPRPPHREEPWHAPGRVLFAGRSRVWGGGVAVFDPAGNSRVAMRAYLLTAEQVADVVAQETARVPGDVVDLTTRRLPGPGLYDALAHLGEHDGAPVYTLATRRRVEPRPPRPAYLRHVVSGLLETHRWSPAECAEYLLDAPGLAPRWGWSEVTALAEDVAESLAS